MLSSGRASESGSAAATLFACVWLSTARIVAMNAASSGSAADRAAIAASLRDVDRQARNALPVASTQIASLVGRTYLIGADADATHCHLPFAILTHVSAQRSLALTGFPLASVPL